MGAFNAHLGLVLKDRTSAMLGGSAKTWVVVAVARRKEDQIAGDFLWFFVRVGKRRAGELVITYLLILSDILTTAILFHRIQSCQLLNQSWT